MYVPFLCIDNDTILLAFPYRVVQVDGFAMLMFAHGTPQNPTRGSLLRRWKVTMQDYFTRMHALGIRLSGVLSSGLGLDPSFFEGCFSKPMSALRLLHYSSEV